MTNATATSVIETIAPTVQATPVAQTIAMAAPVVETTNASTGMPTPERWRRLIDNFEYACYVFGHSLSQEEVADMLLDTSEDALVARMFEFQATLDMGND